MRLALPAAVLAFLSSPALAAGATPVKDIARNSHVTVAGTVDRITDDDEFVLADTTGQVRIYIGRARVPVSPGETVTVTGLVDDGLRLEIYADTIVRADGTTFAFDHDH
jgi:uncharacterized protein YdeI (BOF family)